jgi:hypothetical protein
MGTSKKAVIHLRDAQLRSQPLHFEGRVRPGGLLLTDEVKEVTCKTCLRMLKRAERVYNESLSR